MVASTARRSHLEWYDTDAGQLWHWTAVLRLAESAEAQLHRELGIIDDTFGALPRAHVSVNFRRPVSFGEPLATEISVTELGATSVTYEVRVMCRGSVAAELQMVAVFVSSSDGRPRQWSDELRAALLGDDAPGG